MKYAKAWPTEATQAPAKPNSNVDSNVELGAQVFPKALVQQTVENTVENLLKDAFGPGHAFVPADDEDPQLHDSDAKKRSSKVVKGTVAAVANAPSTSDATQPLWIAFGILAFFTLVFILSLYQRISAMEAWLHGRLTTHT